ncbi:MAG: hypothetical protein HN478_05850, partial [Rhodospirillaceae bacterium]|nr:hypothetical protein [Rhodospirillaceae bacterium]
MRFLLTRRAIRPAGGETAPHNSWRRRFGGLAIIAGLLITAPIFGTSAQSGGNVLGTLDASAQNPLPGDAAIGVTVSSGAPEVQAIADLFREALETSGYQPPVRGGYVLSFQISSDSPHGGGRSALELRGDRGSHDSGDVQLKMRWKMKRGDTAPARRERRLSVTIVDGEQIQVWQAHVNIQASDADDLSMVDA